METSKEQVQSAIARAQAALEDALEELDKLPVSASSSVMFHAHAINNYLTVAGGIVDLILMEESTHLDAQVKLLLEDVRHATGMMARTVSHLMSTSVSTEIPLRLEKADDLSDVVRRVCSYYQRVAAKKAIHINDDSARTVPPVWTDRVALLAILDNLLSNAVKYSQPGKSIWVRTDVEDGWVVFSVRDQGPGLSQDDQVKLFRRGSRLRPRPTGGEASTGYGLAVAKELVERMGGRIWCESELGQGSRFAFRLPVYREELHGTVPT